MQYAWLIGSLILLIIWLVFFVLSGKETRVEMVYVSLITSLLGLTEPLFVPEYWNPPSLFDLAQKTGFDLESVIFAFSIGGLASILYETIYAHSKHKRFSHREMQHRRHRFHKYILISAPAFFLFFYFITNWNVIYVTIVSLFLGGLFTLYCRPDLKNKSVGGAFLFLVLYFTFFALFNLIYPDWIAQVWNVKELTGIMVLRIPLEELLFALSLGFLWSGLYEHLKWLKLSNERKY